MDREQRQHLEQLLRTYQRRLRPLERQAAACGPRTPPEVLVEIDDIRMEIERIEQELHGGYPTVEQHQQPGEMSILRQLWHRALTAFFARKWPQAEALLETVAEIDPQYEDVQQRLAEVDRQQRLQSFYEHICQMRAEDEWEAVIGALEELDRYCPGHPDPQGLRRWAERRRKRAQNQKQCRLCGTPNAGTLAFCVECGTRMA